MTIKGNALMSQSGGPTAVINASVCGVIQSAASCEFIPHIFGATNGILGLLNEDLFDITTESPQTIEALKQTPAAALGSCRYKLGSAQDIQADCERIMQVFTAHNIRFFFYIGGNDSMDTADKINTLAAQTNYDLICLGIPKTVDNDLAHTDHCPGYGSIAKYVATCALEAGRDTDALYTTDTCTILEVMGRNTGWIAAATGMARRCPEDAPHLIYMPEIPFSYDKLITDIKEVLKAFQKVFIVTAEGLKDHQGNFLTADAGAFGEDSFGHRQLGGVAEALKAFIEKEIGIKTRFNKLGTNQRSAMHFASLTDVNEAYLCGQSAFQGAIQGVTGQMVSLIRQNSPYYQCTTGFVDLRDVAHAEKKVPRHYINEKANHITDALRDYVKPLVQGQAPITIGPDGLPVFMRFQRKPVPKKLSGYFNEK